jgi:hypothetical protein
MKLIRMTGENIGLVVFLPNGPHVIDIANSLGVFTPHDPLSNGLLNGALKNGCDWSGIVKHWAHLRSPLKRLANLAAVNPGHPHLAMQPLAEQLKPGGGIDPIVAIEITDSERLEDPTGRRAMERQFGRSRDDEIRQDAPSTAATAEVIDFADRGRHPPAKMD